MLPGLGREKNVKDCVISILSAEWPLTGKKIYNRIRKQHELPVTYQAVHKTLKKLVEDEILIKTEKNYELSNEWINKLSDFGRNLKKTYEDHGAVSMDEIFDGHITNLTFTNLYDYYVFMIDVFDRLANYDKNLYCHFYHLYWALSASVKEFKGLKKMISKYKAGYLLCKGNTHADKIVAAFYKSLRKGNTFIKFGVNCANECEFFVAGDYVIQIFLDDKLKQLLDSSYKGLTKPTPPSLRKLYNSLFTEKVKINFVMHKNPSLAKQIKEKTLKYFERG